MTEIKKTEPPERINGWMDTQMSIARYWGGLTYQGHSYHVAPSEPGAPLVRADVLARDAREAKQAAKDQRKADQQRVAREQGVLI